MIARYSRPQMASIRSPETRFKIWLEIETYAAEAMADLERRAFEFKDTACVGRSHGIHAEPTTFGLKLAQAYAEFDRNRVRLQAARAEIATCAISGAVGTFANIDPRVEAHVAQQLN